MHCAFNPIWKYYQEDNTTEDKATTTTIETTMSMVPVESVCEGWNKIRMGHKDVLPEKPGQPVGVRCKKLPAKKHIKKVLMAFDATKVDKTNAAGIELYCRYLGEKVPEKCTKVIKKYKIKLLDTNEADTLATFIAFFESKDDALAYRKFWTEQNPGKSFDTLVELLGKDEEQEEKQRHNGYAQT